MSATVRAIKCGIKRLPDGKNVPKSNNYDQLNTGHVQIYTPFAFIYAPSPSRLMHMMDPLLQTGIVARCLGGKAYIFDSLITVTKFAAYIGMLDDESLTANDSDTDAAATPPKQGELAECTFMN